MLRYSTSEDPVYPPKVDSFLNIINSPEFFFYLKNFIHKM